MVSCSQHVEFQLPNGHTRVEYLLDAIKNNDAQLQAAMANVRDDTGDGTPANIDKRNDFEATVSYILPSDPVARKGAGVNNRGASDILAVGIDVDSEGVDTKKTSEGFGGKPEISKTGVHLRWHTANEFRQLTRKQKKELFQWRKEQDETDEGVNDSGKKKKRARTQK